MGKIEEEDRPFMIVDNDTGKIFDTRIERHVEKANKESVSSSIYIPTKSKSLLNPDDNDLMPKKDLRRSMRSATWGDWWDEKKDINHKFVRAAEAGNLKDLNKFLNNDMM